MLRILAGFGPGLAALILIWYKKGLSGIQNLSFNLFQLKGLTGWILSAIIFPCLIVAIPIIVLLFRTQLSLELIARGNWWMLIPNFLLTLLFYSSISEEIGWRGVLLVKLQQHYSSIVSSIIVGLLWALWQLPMYFFNGVVEVNLSLTWLFIESVALSIILTWLFNSSKSIVTTMIFNGLYRTLIQFFLPITEFANGVSIFQQSYTIVLVNLAFVLVLFCGGETLVFKYKPYNNSKR